MTRDELDRYFAEQREITRKTIREECEIQMRPIHAALGTVNDSGTGGTGLAGQMARTNARVDEIFRLKHMGLGAIVALSLTGALILLGVKAWVVSLFSH